MKTIKWLAASALSLGLLFTACNKDDDDSLTTEQMVASEDQTAADDLFQDVEDQSADAIETRGGGGGGGNLCPVVTADPDFDTFPRTVTIDYGTDGCEGPGGRIRKGKIVVTETAAWFTAGAVRTITLVDFSIDEAQIEGTRTLTNLDFDANGNVSFSRTVTGAKITFPNGDVATWEANHVLTQTEGGGTPFVWLDNEFEISGGSSGVNRNGKAFTVVITTPLLKKATCFWLSSGSKTLTVEDKTASIDYGDGTCDRKANVTLPNGTTHEILIRRWW